MPSIECRDWLKTLWAASYRGFPYYIESYREAGGRGVVVHKFPNRDTPFLEDLGEESRTWSISGYVVGDQADALSTQFAEVLASRGGGTLVLPLRGPVQARNIKFELEHQRDRLGYVGFSLELIREGASSALISIPYALNLAGIAADGLASALAAFFPTAIGTFGQPDYVIAAAADGVSQAAGVLDAVRTSYPVAATSSSGLRDQLADIVAAAPAAFDRELAPSAADAGAIASNLIAASRALGDAMPAASAARAFREVMDAFAVVDPAPAYLSPAEAQAAANTAEATRLARLSALTAFAEAIVRADYKSRPEGVSARGEFVARCEAELDLATGAEAYPLFIAIETLRGTVVDFLTQRIADLAPIVTVETKRVLPSLFLAWRLYADVSRAGELVDRNNVSHPAFMPKVFQALAPQ
jgi:prophage DNA circulation protein